MNLALSIYLILRAFLCLKVSCVLKKANKLFVMLLSL